MFNLPKPNSEGNTTEKKKEEEDGESEDEKLADDVKEKLSSSNDGNKIYQQQVEKLKTLKGVGTEDRQPSKKQLGYLSIEKVPGSQPIFCMVFRSYMGANLFSGLINTTVSKVKSLLPQEHSNGKNKANKIKAKAAVAVKDPVKGKFEVEHCEITFTCDQDRQLFITTFEEVINHIKQETAAAAISNRA